MKIQKHYEIVENEIKPISKDTEKYSLKDKEFLIEKFFNDLKINQENINYQFNLTKHKNLFTAIINKKLYNIYIDHVDGGGYDLFDNKSINEKNAKKKINIPYSNKNLKNLLLKYENVLVINIYFPFKRNGENNEEKYFYFIISPNEIYSSKPYKNLLFQNFKSDNKQGKINGSNRWVFLTDILRCLNSYEKFVLNNRMNVYILKNENLIDFFNEKIIDNEYDNMVNKNFNETINEIKEQISKNESINDKTFKNYRSIFRIKLLSEVGYHCQIRNCEVTLSECLIASHIKSVNSIIKQESLTIDEKINEIKDTNNGFILCRNHDCLFDKYLITFDSKNGDLISSHYVNQYLKQFNLKDKTKSVDIKSKETSKYLKNHFQEFWKRNVSKNLQSENKNNY